MLLGACNTPPPPQCDFAGDPTAAVEIDHFFALDPGAAGAIATEPGDGGTVPLRRPVQGGFVLYVGALLRNLDPCGVTMQAELKDPQTGAVVSNLDQRQTDLVPSSSYPGWWVPSGLDSLSTVPNIPACPDALGRGAADQLAVVALTAMDSQQRSATLRANVVPTCPANELQADCQCTCGPGFSPGKCATGGM